MESRKPYLATLPGLILGCLVCCALWGSAFPCIKIGYGLFGIPAHDSASQLLFAGLRFTLAGMLVIVGMSVGPSAVRSFRKRVISSPYVSCRSSRLSGSTSFSTWDSRAPVPCRVPSSRPAPTS